MSVEPTTMQKESAREEAEKILRFKIGPQYSLGTPTELDNGGYEFPVVIRLPRVVFDELRSDPVSVNYLEPREVGKIEVTDTGETEFTHPQTIYANVREVEERIQEAVEKALISAAAKDFTKLPFPENRYAPVEDLLAEIILKGSISIEAVTELQSSEDDDKYTKHIGTLEQNELIRRENGRLKPGDILASIQRDTDKNHEALNGALGHFFQENINDLEKLHQVLGPYLAIAGFYYRLAIDSDGLPMVSEKELREAFRAHYSGRGRQTKLKEFKMSRYLLHLERAGILESVTESDGRLWTGDEDIRDEVEEQSQYLGTISNVSTT